MTTGTEWGGKARLLVLISANFNRANCLISSNFNRVKFLVVAKRNEELGAFLNPLKLYVSILTQVNKLLFSVAIK